MSKEHYLDNDEQKKKLHRPNCCSKNWVLLWSNFLLMVWMIYTIVQSANNKFKWYTIKTIDNNIMHKHVPKDGRN